MMYEISDLEPEFHTSYLHINYAFLGVIIFVQVKNFMTG